MARCSHGRSVVTSDLSRPGCCTVTATRNLPSPMPASPRGPPSPSVISHRPPSRAFHGQATTSTSQHNSSNHIPRCTPRMSPILHFALFLAAWMIQLSTLESAGVGVGGQALAIRRHRSEAHPRPALPMVCGLWRVPVASWSSTIPLGHWGHCSPRPRLRPYPRACLLLHTSSSLLAEISALLASLACRQRAKKAQSLF